MAKTNKDAAFGLRAIGKVGQNRDNQGLGEYSISSGDTTKIFFQDAVSATAAGTIHQAAASEAFLLGSLNGVFYTDPTTSKPTFKNYWPGDVAAEATAFVYDNPDDLFEVQTSGTLAQTVASRGNDMAYTAGSTINGRSKEEITGAAVAGGQFTMIRKSEDPSNTDLSTANSNWIVKFNEHVYYNYTNT